MERDSSTLMSALQERLLQELKSYADGRKASVARNAETEALAGVLLEKFGYGLATATRIAAELLDLPAPDLITEVERSVEHVDPRAETNPEKRRAARRNLHQVRKAAAFAACAASMMGQDGAVSSMSKGSSGVERRIIHWLDDDTAVELDVPEVIGPQLEPRLQRRRDVEWLGIIRRSNRDCGGLGRLRATRVFVEVFGRSISILRPSIAEALSAALDGEIKAILRELDETEAKDGERSDDL
jgi:hypothetical protein